MHPKLGLGGLLPPALHTLHPRVSAYSPLMYLRTQHCPPFVLFFISILTLLHFSPFLQVLSSKDLGFQDGETRRPTGHPSPEAGDAVSLLRLFPFLSVSCGFYLRENFGCPDLDNFC